MQEVTVCLDMMNLLGQLSKLTTRLTTPDASVIASRYIGDDVDDGFCYGMKDPQHKLAFHTVNLSAKRLFETIERQLGKKITSNDPDTAFIRSALEEYCLKFGSPERTDIAVHVLTLLVVILTQWLKKATDDAKEAKK